MSTVPLTLSPFGFRLGFGDVQRKEHRRRFQEGELIQRGADPVDTLRLGPASHRVGFAQQNSPAIHLLVLGLMPPSH